MVKPETLLETYSWMDRLMAEVLIKAYEDGVLYDAAKNWTTKSRNDEINNTPDKENGSRKSVEDVIY